jgi:hypothetical protein
MPVLSIIVATTQGWPEVGPCLDSIYQQAQEVGAEILLADGHGSGLPKEENPFPKVRWLKMPGSSVFQLRAHAMAEAKAKIIAITEDHCRVQPDWCSQILSAFDRFPNAAAIGGAVENGATESLSDWASFFYVNGSALPPLGSGERKQITLQANISYKREVIPDKIPPLGRMEWIFNEELRANGKKLFIEDRIVVAHVQSLGFRDTCLIHYDDSRSIAGFRLQSIGLLERMVRLGACAIMPPALFGRALMPMIRNGRYWKWKLASLPMLWVLVCCRAVGAFVGFIAGPGKSPYRIR